MEYWYERFKELRLKKKMSQGKMARALGIDASSISRYERSKEDVDLTENFLMRLGKFFNDEEISYIKTGNSKRDTKVYGCEEECNSGYVEERFPVDSDLPSDIITIVEILRRMDIDKRMDVLHYTLGLNK